VCECKHFSCHHNTYVTCRCADPPATALLSVLMRMLEHKAASDRTLKAYVERMECVQAEQTQLQRKLDMERKAKAGVENKLYGLERTRRMELASHSEQTKKLQKKVKALEKNMNMVKRRDTQYKNDLKKKEMEFRKLQNKLDKVASMTKVQEKALQVRYVNTSLPSSAAASAATRKGKASKPTAKPRATSTSAEAKKKAGAPKLSAEVQENKILRETISQYEHRLYELVSENDAVRQSMLALETEFQGVLAAHIFGAEETAEDAGEANAAAAEREREEQDDFRPTLKELEQMPARLRGALAEFHPNEQILKLPFSQVQGAIEEGMRGQIELLKMRTAAESSSLGGECVVVDLDVDDSDDLNNTLTSLIEGC
jgi:chromosome segregation ATPase